MQCTQLYAFKSEFTQYLSKVHFSNIRLPTKSIPNLFQK